MTRRPPSIVGASKLAFHKLGFLSPVVVFTGLSIRSAPLLFLQAGNDLFIFTQNDLFDEVLELLRPIDPKLDMAQGRKGIVSWITGRLWIMGINQILRIS